MVKKKTSVKLSPTTIFLWHKMAKERGLNKSAWLNEAIIHFAEYQKRN